jgi:hypothetical protein
MRVAAVEPVSSCVTRHHQSDAWEPIGHIPSSCTAPLPQAGNHRLWMAVVRRAGAAAAPFGGGNVRLTVECLVGARVEQLSLIHNSSSFILHTN